jgi:hypothetical protein
MKKLVWRPCLAFFVWLSQLICSEPSFLLKLMHILAKAATVMKPIICWSVILVVLIYMNQQAI